MKVLTQYGNPEGNKIAVTAALVGTVVEFSEGSKELSKHTANQQPPIFTASFGSFTHSAPVLKFLAHSSELYPAQPEIRVQVDELLEVFKDDIEKPAAAWLSFVFGTVPTNADKLKESQTAVKKFLFIIEQRLKKTPFLVGETLTLADISLASTLVWPFRALFNEAYRKPFPSLTKWFTTVTANPAFTAVWGAVKLAKVALEAPAPVVVAKPEPVVKKEEKKVEKPKNDDEEEEKVTKKVNAVDLLPPTSFELDEWKKLISNTKDRKSVLPTFWEKLDKAGWSAWFIHYEKAEGEGSKLVPFENLLDGFVQRMEAIRRHSFGTIGIYGEIPNLELKGVLLLRGQEILEGLLEHPQFEYCKSVKLNWEDDEDRKKIEDYWTNVTEETSVVDGLVLQVIRFWK